MNRRLALVVGCLAAVGLLPVTSTWAVDPIAHWQFNEGSGTNSVDSSGNDCDLKLVGSPTWISAGLASNALSFATASDWAEAAHWDEANLTNALTLSIWINPAEPGYSAPGYSQFFKKGASYYSGWGLYLMQTRQILFQLTGQNGNSLASSILLPTNRWTHVAATFDGSTAQLFINGLLEKQATWTGERLTNSNPVTIGQVPTAMALDQIRIYDSALSTSEIQDLFFEFDTDADSLPDANETLAGTNPNDTDSDDDGFTDGQEVAADTDPLDDASYPDLSSNLAGWWRLDEGTGTTSVDFSGAGNNASFEGSPVWTSGAISNALSFAGGSDALEAGVDGVAGSSLAVTNFAFAYWSLVTNVSQNATLIARTQYFGGYSVIWQTSYSRVIPNLPGIPVVQVYLSEVITNTWQHHAFTYDGQTVRSYFNGVERNSAVYTNVVIDGLIKLTLADPYQGRLDDVRIYDRALTPGELFVLANADTYQGFDTDLLDNDGDRLLNGWETANGLDPDDASGDNGAWGDPDGDGYTNLQEYEYDSTPGQSNSVPAGIPADLAAWFEFSEGTGNIAADFSGNANHGTLWEDPQWTTNGISGDAIGFNGVNQNLSAPPSPTLDNTNAFTFAVWVNTTNATDRAVVSYRFVGGSSGWRLFYSLNKILFQWNSLSNYLGTQAVGSFPSNEWAHLAVVYDAPTAKVFLNGNQVASNTDSGGGMALTSSDKLYLGRTTAGGSYWFPGQVDDALLYRRALSTNEVAALYNMDTDGDGLSNVSEVNQHLTDPDNPDTDGDGLPDGWEVVYGLEPLDATGDNGATGDLDSDGVNNLTEYLQGRDPTVGAVPDTAGLVNLNVYTPLE